MNQSTDNVGAAGESKSSSEQQGHGVGQRRADRPAQILRPIRRMAHFFHGHMDAADHGVVRIDQRAVHVEQDGDIGRYSQDGYSGHSRTGGRFWF